MELVYDNKIAIVICIRPSLVLCMYLIYLIGIASRLDS